MTAKSSSPIQQPRLYEMVADRISRDYVLKTSPGDRLPTETEFAELYHVSVPTVWEALRSLVQAGFLHRRQGSGTYRKDMPKTAPAKSKDKAPVALVTPLDLSDGSLSCHFVQIALQTSKCLKEMGLGSQIYFGETAPASDRTFDDSILCKDIEDGRVSAAVLIAESHSRGGKYLDLLTKHSIPTLRTDVTTSSSGESRMHVFLETAVETLMRHGRRKISCIGFGAVSSPIGNSDFSRIVASKGGITDDSWMIGDLHPNTTGSGYSLMREIWTTGRIKPDGLVLCDDIFIEDATLAIRELGIKSPEQLLVVTYRNKGERLHAPFPVIELQYDAIPLSAQIASNIALMLSGKPQKPLVSDPVLVDPFAEDLESLPSAPVALHVDKLKVS